MLVLISKCWHVITVARWWTWWTMRQLNVSISAFTCVLPLNLIYSLVTSLYAHTHISVIRRHCMSCSHSVYSFFHSAPNTDQHYFTLYFICVNWVPILITHVLPAGLFNERCWWEPESEDLISSDCLSVTVVLMMILKLVVSMIACWR